MTNITLEITEAPERAASYFIYQGFICIDGVRVQRLSALGGLGVPKGTTKAQAELLFMDQLMSGYYSDDDLCYQLLAALGRPNEELAAWWKGRRVLDTALGTRVGTSI